MTDVQRVEGGGAMSITSGGSGTIFNRVVGGGS